MTETTKKRTGEHLIMVGPSSRGKQTLEGVAGYRCRSNASTGYGFGHIGVNLDIEKTLVG